MFATNAYAQQVEDVQDPLLKYEDQEKELKFTIGGRLMADVANYQTELAPMKSGVAITDARVRTSLTYKDLYFFADFDFSKGKFSQKNIFARYTFKENEKGTHSLQAGYFGDPASMSRNTSKYNYHFMSRPATVYALAAGRELGIAYKFHNQNVMLQQGIFAEKQYNNQEDGSQGFTASGRWVYKPINEASNTVHVGVSARYAKMNTGAASNDVLMREQILESDMQTEVDPTTRFLHATLPWASGNLNLGVEALWRNDKFFVRGEYLHKTVYKTRDDKQLFENQLGGAWSWGSLESWQKGNPIRSSKFSGGYVELGYLLKGDRYTYDDANALLNGMNDKKSCEIDARFSHTNLNDINDGDIFLTGRQQFYPNGTVTDYPATSTSVGGGVLNAASIGVNYSLNQYVKLMGEYQYSNLDNVYFPLDKNFHTFQMKLLFSF
jgi:phosphate-selective porin OprO/OprP